MQLCPSNRQNHRFSKECQLTFLLPSISLENLDVVLDSRVKKRFPIISRSALLKKLTLRRNVAVTWPSTHSCFGPRRGTSLHDLSPSNFPGVLPYISYIAMGGAKGCCFWTALVWKLVYFYTLKRSWILMTRSENGYECRLGKLHILVWDKVRVWKTDPHTPRQKFRVSRPPPPFPPPLGTNYTVEVGVTRHCATSVRGMS